MSEWTTLGVVCSDGVIQTGPFGSQLHAEDYVNDGIPVVMPADIRDGRVDTAAIARVRPEDVERLARHKLREGDIVYSRRGDITRCALITDREVGWLCGTGCLLVRPGSGIDYRWLFYWLSTVETHEWLYRHAVGATMLNLNTTILSALPVNLLPLEEQRRIAGVLGALDSLIENHRSSVGVAVELARALLSSAPTSDTIRVSDIAQVRRGLSYKGSGLSTEGMPMVNMGSAANFGWLKREGLKHYVGDFKPRHVARAGDLIVTNTEQTWRQEIIGWPMLVPSDVAEALFTHHTYVVDFEPQHRRHRLPFWAHLFTQDARARIDGAIRGTTVANLPPDAIENLEFPVPPAGHRSVQAAEALLEAAWADELAVADLTRTRDELLPLLMSGHVRVRPSADPAPPGADPSASEIFTHG